MSEPFDFNNNGKLDAFDMFILDELINEDEDKYDDCDINDEDDDF